MTGDLGNAILVREAAGVYEPISVVSTMAEARELAYADERRYHNPYLDTPRSPLDLYRLWVRDSAGLYRRRLVEEEE